MQARTRQLVFARPEDFGCSVYVSDRDDNFLLDMTATAVVQKYTTHWRRVSEGDSSACLALARIGVLDVRQDDGNAISQEAFSGVHLVGGITDIPVVRHPLVVNCFSTAWCPLQCVYCHADDLMKDFRFAEAPDGIARVAETASKIPALAYVITGGDPLTRPDRAMFLAQNLSDQAGVVVDTSGVGRIEDALALAKSRPMHVRISIDSMDPRINRVTRPINQTMKASVDYEGMQSLDFADRMIEKISPYATGVSVQTVISSKNDRYEHLLQLRDWLVSRGVKNWVLHVAVNAGAAARFSLRTDRERQRIDALSLKEVFAPRKISTILPDPLDAARSIKKIIDDTERRRIRMDIRCTDANTAPNSVFLIGSEGDLFTQGRGKEGSRKVPLLRSGAVLHDQRAIWTYVSSIDHVQRYINFLPSVHGAPVGIPIGTECQVRVPV